MSTWSSTTTSWHPQPGSDFAEPDVLEEAAEAAERFRARQGIYRHPARPKRDREPAVIRFTVPTLTEAVLEDAEGFEKLLRAIGDLDRALFLFGAAKEIDRG